jgi:hypothetical protein
MSSGMRVSYLSPLLLATATTLSVALPAPAAAQRVEVFVNGQRVTDVVINGRVNGNGVINGRVNGNGAVNGHVNGFRNGNGHVNGFRNGAVNGHKAVNGFINGANGRHINGANGRRVILNGNGVNGRRVILNGNGVNGRVRLIPGEGNIGPGVRWGLHNKTHSGSYDVCRFDPAAGMGICSRSRSGLHTGPHRGLFSFPRRDFAGF